LYLPSHLHLPLPFISEFFNRNLGPMPLLECGVGYCYRYTALLDSQFQDCRAFYLRLFTSTQGQQGIITFKKRLSELLKTLFSPIVISSFSTMLPYCGIAQEELSDRHGKRGYKLQHDYSEVSRKTSFISISPSLPAETPR
jgi:hypothetical protein